MKRIRDIAVVGAGPVGLATALLLERAGYKVVLIAPSRTTADRRTSALLAGSVALLDEIGIWVRLNGLAAPLKSIRIVDATQRIIRAPEVVFDAGEIGLAAFGYNIGNEPLLAALEAEAHGRGIERVADAVEQVVAADGAVTATLSSGDEVVARLIAAADGRRSRVRQSIGIAVREWRYDQAAMVTNLRHSLPHEDCSTEFHTETGPFTLVPLATGRSSLVWVDRPAEAERRSLLSDDALAAEIELRSASILGKITIDGPRQVFPLAGMNAQALAGGRAVLLGEAAHLFPPIGAQGLNLGYRDVAALGKVLRGPVADPGSAGRLAAYDRARRPDVLSRTVAIDALNRTLLTDLIPVQGLRGLGLFLLDRIAPLRRAVMRQGVSAVSETDRPARGRGRRASRRRLA
jgi:2-octaprenyl-6-methoxyphenol hydroxylase